MAVFHVMPRNYLIGAWVATEDIHGDSGPLVFYPGSHRSPFFDQFDHYPYTNLRTCSPEDTQAYDAFLTQEAKGYPQKTFVCEKGDILFWHGMLIHGGHPIRNEALTRRSFVVHFLPERSNWAPKVEGPSNW
jgi:ectoine hydroxylase-related dioxygenase (phytanoyl-CoA dioxygenase family)